MNKEDFQKALQEFSTIEIQAQVEEVLHQARDEVPGAENLRLDMMLQVPIFMLSDLVRAGDIFEVAMEVTHCQNHILKRLLKVVKDCNGYVPKN